MNTFTLSLIFLSPLISYATYILLQENRDPLHGFHDNYLKSSRIKGIGKDDLSPKAAKVFGQTIPGPKVLIFIFSLALPILFLAGVSPRLMVIIGI